MVNVELWTNDWMHPRDGPSPFTRSTIVASETQLRCPILAPKLAFVFLGFGGRVRFRHSIPNALSAARLLKAENVKMCFAGRAEK